MGTTSLVGCLSAAAVGVSLAHGQGNVIVNGDFSLGNTGFLTDYQFANINTSEGQYTISSTPSAFNSAFSNPPSATPMMVVNGATQPGLRVWRQTVTVQPGTIYALRLDGFTAVSGGPAVLRFSVNGEALLPALTLAPAPGEWRTLEVHWAAINGATSAAVIIDDLNTATFPNDFYLDNISMVGVGVIDCNGADFNCDGDVGTDSDIEAFFACLAGSCPLPPCTSTADFDGDGDTGTDRDIEAFFRVLAGGSC